MSRFAGAVVVVACLAGCGGDAPPAPEPVAPAPEPVVPEALLGTYEGTLPCADCDGLATKLSLYTEDSPGKLATTYKISQARPGEAPVDSSGDWIVLRGSAADPDDTVWELDPADPDASRAFLRVSETELRLLDREYRELGSGPVTLLRTFPAPIVEVGEADAGRTIEMVTGQALVVRLPGNRTTGYIWAFVPVRVPVLIADDSSYTPDPHPEGFVGGGGVEMLRFTAFQAGKQTLTLQYKRPFEKDVPPVREVAFQVVVK